MHDKREATAFLHLNAVLAPALHRARAILLYLLK
jgi:hypothetical protein